MATTKMRFSTFDIHGILNVERARLMAWMGFGHIVPSAARAKGAGTKNLFSIGDLHKIYLFKRLLDTGFRRRNAAVLVKATDLTIRKHTGLMFKGGIVVKIDPMEIRSNVGVLVIEWKKRKERRRAAELEKMKW